LTRVVVTTVLPAGTVTVTDGAESRYKPLIQPSRPKQTTGIQPSISVPRTARTVFRFTIPSERKDVPPPTRQFTFAVVTTIPVAVPVVVSVLVGVFVAVGVLVWVSVAVLVAVLVDIAVDVGV
jgi:hypothetical protein